MDRKSFLKKTPLLGATAALALAGCNTGTGSVDIDLTGDAEILTLAAIREDQAINTYQAVIDSDKFSSQAILETLGLFKDHHSEHLTIFNALLLDLEQNEINSGSQGLSEGFNQNDNEEETLIYTMNLELGAAQAYFIDAFQQLQGLNAKLKMGEIYPIELAHFLSLKEALGRSPIINAATFSEINAGI